jgi:hypothetical protein
MNKFIVSKTPGKGGKVSGPEAAMSMALNGDQVYIEAGAYTLAAVLVMKDGVNIEFAEGVTILFDTSDYVFDDDGVEITAKWTGFMPTITNATTAANQVRLQNTSSVLNFAFPSQFRLTSVGLYNVLFEQPVLTL